MVNYQPGQVNLYSPYLGERVEKPFSLFVQPVLIALRPLLLLPLATLRLGEPSPSNLRLADPVALALQQARRKILALDLVTLRSPAQDLAQAQGREMEAVSKPLPQCLR